MLSVITIERSAKGGRGSLWNIREREREREREATVFMVPALAGGWKKKGRNDRTTVGQIWRGPFKLPNNFTGPQGWEKSWNKRRGSHGVRRKTGKDVGRDSGIPAATVEPIHAFNSPFFYAFNYTLVTFFCLQPTN